MSRLYSVTLQSQTLPITFNIVTIPTPGDESNTNHAMASPEAIGIRIYEPFSLESSAEVSTRLANLVAFTLWKGRKRNAREIESIYEARAIEFHEFVTWVALQDFIPVESSPLHGKSLDSLMKTGSLMGFATMTENYGLVHHDPVICIVALPMTIVIGASVGAGEVLQEHVKRLLGSTRTGKKRTHSKTKKLQLEQEKSPDFSEENDTLRRHILPSKKVWEEIKGNVLPSRKKKRKKKDAP